MSLGTLRCPRQEGQAGLRLVRRAVLVTSLSICKMFKRSLTCFLQHVCVKRQKEAFCQRNQMNNTTGSEEGFFEEEELSVMFCTCLKTEKKGRERAVRLWLSTQSGAARAV